jgi:hypothetical protein
MGREILRGYTQGVIVLNLFCIIEQISSKYFSFLFSGTKVQRNTNIFLINTTSFNKSFVRNYSSEAGKGPSSNPETSQEKALESSNVSNKFASYLAGLIEGDGSI